VQDIHLVIAGGKGWMFADVFSAIHETGLEHRVHVIGHVHDDDLPALYNLSSVFAMPSKYEGFGLPVLEAMACGVPVVASNTSAMPEVAGQAALLVDAGDSDSLEVAMLRLLTDDALRAELAAKGELQARRFSWETSAQKLLEAYKATVTPATLLRQRG
jgi:glycosyltransferase involved in cell wall biosynthesis